jgi:transposase
MARKKFTASFKAQVALELLKNESTLAEIANKHGVHPSQVKDWKTTLVGQAESLFARKNAVQEDKSEYIEALERKAGQQAVELDFLKKNYTAYQKKSG